VTIELDRGAGTDEQSVGVQNTSRDLFGKYAQPYHPGAEKRGVILTGFGTFRVSKRKARKGRNLKTGETIQIAAKRIFKFTPELRKALLSITSNRLHNSEPDNFYFFEQHTVAVRDEHMNVPPFGDHQSWIVKRRLINEIEAFL
jgi:hypothetical protein